MDRILAAIGRVLSREGDLLAKIVSAAKFIEDLIGNHEYWTPEWSTTAAKAKMKDDAETHREAAEALWGKVYSLQSYLQGMKQEEPFASLIVTIKERCCLQRNTWTKISRNGNAR